MVARISGNMDCMTGPGLWEQINEVLAGGTAFVVLDLSDVSFCDSAGLNVLVRASRRAGLSDVALALACVPQPVLRILEMTGADQVLQVCDTVAEAEAAFGDRGDAAGSLA
ncbi:STAS domain-containing protein [Streptomyces bobili]|uniref:STAS domain-containing protein n=1 Tax=Streptomyces bobili TaxID=67280 RepID=UPI003442B3A5